MTKSVPEAEFEANCHTLIAEVVTNGDEVIVTKDGKAVAKLVRAEEVSLRGPMHGRGKTLGDIVSPLDEEWDAMK
jgi:antitoxin (DNA-binding transcriptional repressor) of toxin-antitoxin stability system